MRTVTNIASYTNTETSFCSGQNLNIKIQTFQISLTGDAQMERFSVKVMLHSFT